MYVCMLIYVLIYTGCYEMNKTKNTKLMLMIQTCHLSLSGKTIHMHGKQKWAT